MTAQRKVFISNMGRDHNYSSASKYGAICSVTEGNFPIYAMARLVEEVATNLASSTPEDYLAVSGSATVAALCLATWLTMHDKCNLLLYRPADDSYVVRVLSRDAIRNELTRAGAYGPVSGMDSPHPAHTPRGVRPSVSRSRRKEDTHNHSD